ncbi:MAG: hypothetical protein ABI747_00920 [Candidatus Moraniibacteriota bacterium]
MLSITRETKRLIVIVIYLLIALAIGLLVYFINRPAPTCYDNKQNQDEAGVDCGGVCTNACIVKLSGQDIQSKSVTVIPDGAGRYDVVAEIYNPNSDVGAASFTYTLHLRDASGRELARERGNSWILPRETKAIIAYNLPAGTTPDKGDIEISSLDWQPFTGYQEKPNLNIYQKRYNQISSGVGFGEALGTLSNESPFDFRTVTIKVVLRDAGGTPLAVNQTEMRTLSANEQRDFRLVWPTAFPGTVGQVDMEVDADVYRSENFIKRYFPGGQFQKVQAPGAF